MQQWSAMNGFSLPVSTHEILNISESTILKFNYILLWFIFTHYNVDLQYTGCNEYVYNVDIELIPFEKCLILNLSIILINESSDSKFTVLVVVAFTTKEKSHISKNHRTTSKANTQPSSKYFSVRIRFILIWCFVHMLSCEEIRNQQHHTCCYVWIWRVPSNFEYE